MQTSSVTSLVAEKSVARACDSAGKPGLKKAKLGMVYKGEAISSAIDPSHPLNDNTPGKEKGVDGSTRNAEKEDLQVNVGDFGSEIKGEAVLKLMS